MCLGVPGRVVQWVNTDGVFSAALVEFAGIRREVQMACVPDVRPGDYVVVHAGVAISRIDEAAALQAIQDLNDGGEEKAE